MKLPIELSILWNHKSKYLSVMKDYGVCCGFLLFFFISKLDLISFSYGKLYFIKTSKFFISI